MATKLRSGPCSAQRLAVRPPPPPALPTGGCQGVDLPRSVHGDKTNKQAAAEGFRLEIVGDDIDSGEGLVDEIFALVLGNSRPDRFSYRLVALKDLGTTERERALALTSAAAEGFGFRGLVQAPLVGYAVLVLEHDGDTEAARLEYLVLSTVRLATLERELAEAAGLGYGVMALTMQGAGAFDSNDRIAILTRPHPEEAPGTPAPAP